MIFKTVVQLKNFLSLLPPDYEIRVADPTEEFFSTITWLSVEIEQKRITINTQHNAKDERND